MTTKKPADALQKQTIGMAQGKRSEHPTLAEARADKDGNGATSVVANDQEDRRKGAYRFIGGSQSDDWNMGVAEQAVAALWITNSGSDFDRQMNATLAALKGIGPKDELEGMMAAQLITAHNAAMECYRRAMLGDQTFEGRRENLNQANKLSRTWATLVEALNRYRGKGQQKVIVEHVHVHAGGQAMVGNIESSRDRSLPSEEKMSAIAYAPEPTLSGPDQTQNAVPVARSHRTAATQRIDAERWPQFGQLIISGGLVV
jgi:hypothetical protein